MKMRFTILPYQGAGALRFGMTVAEIRKQLHPNAATPFQKSPSSSHPTDAFDELGANVYYQKDGRCEAIEFAEPAIPLFEKSKLIGVPFSKVAKLLRSLDDKLEIDESGLTSYKLGLAIYCPGHQEKPSMIVHGVFVFERGYYDS
jgi:hypothetical protein